MDPRDDGQQNTDSTTSNPPIISVPASFIPVQETISALPPSLAQAPAPQQPLIQTPDATILVKKKKIWPFIVAGVVLLLVICIAGVIVVQNFSRVDIDKNIASANFIPTADIVANIDFANYTPVNVKTEQMAGNDVVVSSEQTVSFKLSSDWEFYKEYSDDHYSGDPFFSRATDSGDALFGIYTIPAVSTSDNIMTSEWQNIDQITEKYIESMAISPDNQSNITIGNKKWSVLMFNNSTTGKNADTTTFLAIDDNGNFTDLAYIAEVITPNVMAESDFKNVIKDVKYTIANITSDAN